MTVKDLSDLLLKHMKYNSHVAEQVIMIKLNERTVPLELVAPGGDWNINSFFMYAKEEKDELC